MLVLMRKPGEKVYVGENLTVTVVEIDRGRVRLGFEAPRDVPIYRAELCSEGQRTPPESKPCANTNTPPA